MPLIPILDAAVNLCKFPKEHGFSEESRFPNTQEVIELLKLVDRLETTLHHGGLLPVHSDDSSNARASKAGLITSPE